MAPFYRKGPSLWWALAVGTAGEVTYKLELKRNTESTLVDWTRSLKILIICSSAWWDPLSLISPNHSSLFYALSLSRWQQYWHKWKYAMWRKPFDGMFCCFINSCVTWTPWRTELPQRQNTSHCIYKYSSDYIISNRLLGHVRNILGAASNNSSCNRNIVNAKLSSC